MAYKILMLEHDEDDRYITSSYFENAKPSVEIIFVQDSEAFWGRLNEMKAPPALILLTYQSYPSSAPELLREIKGSPRFAAVPVVVLSGTVNDTIAEDCYRAGASSFIQKPATERDTQAKINSFISYWFETVHLPTK